MGFNKGDKVYHKQYKIGIFQNTTSLVKSMVNFDKIVLSL